ARLVRLALIWGSASAIPVTVIAYLVRGRDGAISALIALGIVLANAATAGLISGLAARFSTYASAMISLPSFSFRMIGIFTALASLKGRSFIDDPTFASTFAVAVVTVIWLEALAWKRTPWIALTLKEKA
ncbi:MAG TPA: hypothetical protein VM600_10360, partial [Actinomycetota bacterium]|nr:hypothetical protein [Actinomycetota bacterium]